MGNDGIGHEKGYGMSDQGESAEAPKRATARKPAAKKTATAKKPVATTKKLVATEKPAAAAKPLPPELASLAESAEKGNAAAARELGQRYKNGNGVDVDLTLAEHWWEKAAEAGDATSMWDLGYFHLIGKYLDRDPDKAIKWFERAAAAGSDEAAFELGLAYENGQFVPQDYDAAEVWLKKAAELGHPSAQSELVLLGQRRAHVARVVAHREAHAESSSPSIVLDHVTKKFGDHTVINDITLTIKGGELVAIVGSSGGGKSTLVNMIRGVLAPTSGTIGFEGTAGFVPQQNLVHESLTVSEQLSYYATSVKRLPKADRPARISQVLEDLDLGHVAHTLVGKCSGGEKRRVSVACELLARPDSLLLDEPTSGLDPGDSGSLIEVLHGLVQTNDMTILVINHDYENIEIFDKIVFLAKGRICFYGTPHSLFDYFDTASSRTIYDLMRTNPDPFIRRFDEWRANNPTAEGGIR